MPEYAAHTMTGLGLALTLVAGACTWTPDVRPVQPSQISEGPVYVLDHQEVAGRDYLLVIENYRERLTRLLAQSDGSVDIASLGPTELRDKLDGLQKNILAARSGKSCRIPGSIYGYFFRRKDPTSRAVDGVRIAYRSYDGNAYHVQFMDEHCADSGASVQTWSYPSSYRAPAADHDAALLLDQDDVLWTVDPFEGSKNRVATHVLAWHHVAAPPNDSLGKNETGVILLEGDRPAPADPPADGSSSQDAPLFGELVVRNLQGKEIARFGTDVRNDFVQTNYGGLRVAWISGGQLYEAVAPDLKPVRLTPKDGTACSPRYTSGALEFLFPCDQGEVNRLSLATGDVEQLDPGVNDQWQERGWTFEMRYVGDPDPETGQSPTHLWAKAPGEDSFTRVKPDLYSMRPIDDQRLLGIGTTDGDYGPLGTWQRGQGFETIFESVAYYYTFEDTRYTADRNEPVYLWLVHHDVVHGVGDISQLSSRGLSIMPVAQDVPVGGYRQYGFTALVNPALVMLRDMTPDGGVLEARLIPDLIGTRVDEGVLGFAARSSYQEPGLYYSVGPGEREGIWFAPL